MKDIEVLTTDEYANIMKCFNFDKITLCEDIEKKVGI